MEQENCTLGSGELYIKEHVLGTEIPTHAIIETEENKIGSIQSGAEVSYAPEIKEVIDSLGICLKRFVTSAEVLFKTGIMTWNNNTLLKLSAAGELVKTAQKSTLKLGGQGALKTYLVRFVHTLDSGCKYRVTIVGTSTAGFTLKFDGTDETVIDAEFKAMACDNKGTQVILEEELQVPASK